MSAAIVTPFFLLAAVTYGMAMQRAVALLLERKAYGDAFLCAMAFAFPVTELVRGARDAFLS